MYFFGSVSDFVDLSWFFTKNLVICDAYARLLTHDAMMVPVVYEKLTIKLKEHVEALRILKAKMIIN